jgi:two-component system, LytTR family, sensor kinase
MKREERRAGGGTARIALAVWTAFGLLFALTLFWQVRTHGHSPFLIALYALLVWWAWAAAMPLVAWLGRRWPLSPFRLRVVPVHLVAAVVLGTLHDLWWNGLLVWMRPFDDMGATDFWNAFGKDYVGRAFSEVMIYGAVLGTTYAIDYRRRLHEREIAALELERSLAHASLHALELQMQPHFLFNTLHAIGGLVRQSRSAEAVEMIAGLSDLLRYSLEHAGKHLVPLGREIEILGRYLDIQRIRFPDRLSVAIDVPGELRRAAVPALILQPLAENAIRHGIEPSAAPGVIRLTAAREGDDIRLELFNSGRVAGPAGSGIGLENTRARLDQLYGGRHSFALAERGGGVVARLVLPFEETER